MEANLGHPIAVVLEDLAASDVQRLTETSASTGLVMVELDEHVEWRARREPLVVPSERDRTSLTSREYIAVRGQPLHAGDAAAG